MVELAILIEIGIPKVGLRLAGMVVKRNVPLLVFQSEFLLFRSNIVGYETVGTGKALCLVHEALVNTLGSVPLLARGFLVILEPLVYCWLERVKF